MCANEIKQAYFLLYMQVTYTDVHAPHILFASSTISCPIRYQSTFWEGSGMHLCTCEVVLYNNLYSTSLDLPPNSGIFQDPRAAIIHGYLLKLTMGEFSS